MKAMHTTLTQLNAMSADAFVATLAGIFEHSPWVAEAVAGERPFPGIDALHDAIVSVRAGFAGAELLALWPGRNGWTLQRGESGPDQSRGRPGGRGTQQPPGGLPGLPEPAHRRLSPAPRLLEARRQLASAARADGRRDDPQGRRGSTGIITALNAWDCWAP